jgi:hypothetical protein
MPIIDSPTCSLLMSTIHPVTSPIIHVKAGPLGRVFCSMTRDRSSRSRPVEIALLDEQHGGEVVLLHLDVLGHGKAYSDLPISDVRVSAADEDAEGEGPGPFLARL